MSEALVYPFHSGAPTRLVPPPRTPGRSLPRSATSTPTCSRPTSRPSSPRAGCSPVTPARSPARGTTFLTFRSAPSRWSSSATRPGVLRGHHNVLRPTGIARLPLAPRGLARALVCPYHQWTYGLDGALRAARLMGDSFRATDTVCRPWRSARSPGWCSCRCDAHAVPDRNATRPRAAAAPAPAGPGEGGRPHHLPVRANWKTVIENNRECYHCRGSHPEFLRSNFDFGIHGDIRRSDAYDRTSPGLRPVERDGLAPATSTSPAVRGTG